MKKIYYIVNNKKESHILSNNLYEKLEGKIETKSIFNLYDGSLREQTNIFNSVRSKINFCYFCCRNKEDYNELNKVISINTKFVGIDKDYFTIEDVNYFTKSKRLNEYVMDNFRCFYLHSFMKINNIDLYEFIFNDKYIVYLEDDDSDNFTSLLKLGVIEQKSFNITKYIF